MTDVETEDRAPTLLDRVGGVSGLVYASLPTLAYTVVNAIAGLNAAVVVAVGASAGLIVLRMLRKERIAPAVSGLIGVAIAAVIAYRTGSAESYFLPGIWFSFLAAVVFTASVIVRRPAVGMAWQLFTNDRAGPAWRSDPVALRAFDIATLTFAAVFAARFAVQQWLYDAGSTGWLAVARIAMGYPLIALALVVTYWAVRRVKGRFKGESSLAAWQHDGAGQEARSPLRRANPE